MRFLMMVKAEAPSGEPGVRLMAAMGTFVEEQTKAGTLVDTGGVQENESGTSMALAGGKITTTDGPFTEANEVIGGYIIVDVPAKKQALEIAHHFLDVHAKIMGPNYKAETIVRRMYTIKEEVRPEVLK